jgi:hypothetical protein
VHHTSGGRVKDSLVVRNLSQDGVEGSSASVVNLFDPKERLGRFFFNSLRPMGAYMRPLMF